MLRRNVKCNNTHNAMVGTQEKEASIWHVLFGIQRDNANLYYANMHNAVNTDMG